MVRDDFWLAVSRFLKCLDIPIVERENSALVDLFEIDHAEKVLGLFGQAYGRLDQDPTQWSQANREFIRNTVDGLARNRKIISVRLALFAEMMKGRQWVPESLDAVGGTDGVGITFLEETFNSPTAPAVYRGHAAAVQGLLGALLPDPGVEIKGIKKSYTSLAQASGYADQPGAFSELVTILHRDLKIITAVSEEKAELPGQELGSLPLGTGAGERSYQLTHDYLVRPLREWLTRKQKETRQGRAELMLQERVAIWRDKKENKQLPSLPETLSIYYYTRPSSWDTDERAMMGKSLRVHTSIWGGALAAILVTLGSVLFYTLNEKSGQLVDNLVDSGQGASIAFNIRDLRGYPKWLVHRHLKRKADELKSKPNDDQKSLALRIAMDFFGLSNSLNDPSEKLVDLLNQTKSSDNDHSTEEAKASFKLLRNDSLNVILAIHNQPEQLKEAFEKLKPNAINTGAQRYIRWRKQARIAIASLILGNSQFAKELCDTKQSDLGPRSTFIDEFKNWQFERIATDFQTEQLMVGYGTQLTSLETLISVLGQDKSDNSIDLMSAICLGLGGIDLELFPADRSFLNPIRNKLYKEHRSALIHSSCQWLLETWGDPAASEQASSEQASSNATPPQDAQWDDSLGMVFLKFRFEKNDQRIHQEMWIGATEVAEKIFKEFLNDISDQPKVAERNPMYLPIDKCKKWWKENPDKTREGRKSESQLPWGNATYYDSLRFCNWLSLKYNLEPCYEFIEENTDAEDPDSQFEDWKKIQFNEDASGFRLLRSSEWEEICSGSTNTRFPAGSFSLKDEILEQYIYCKERYNRTVPGRIGQTRPNQFGFLDLLGNTNEWTAFEDHTKGTLSPFSGSLIGGSYGDTIESLRPILSDGKYGLMQDSSSPALSERNSIRKRGLRIAVPEIPSKK
jgi:formylglycine-generating enzyme required for sulfatase activity